MKVSSYFYWSSIAYEMVLDCVEAPNTQVIQVETVHKCFASISRLMIDNLFLNNASWNSLTKRVAKTSINN